MKKMKTIVCKNCGKSYPDVLTCCPQCMTPKPKNIKKTIGLIIACIFGFLFSLGVMLTIFEDDENIAIYKNEENVYQSSSETENTSSGSEQPVVNIGETVDVDGLRITFQKAEDYTSDNMFITPKDGYKFIRAYFIMENTSEDDKTGGAYDFDCFADNIHMEQSYLDNGLDPITGISKGRKIEGYLYFEVPTNPQTIEIEYEINLWTSEKVIFKVK